MNDHEHLPLRHVARAACQNYVVMMVLFFIAFALFAKPILWALGALLGFVNDLGNG